MWGYAEGNRTALTIVVGVVIVGALVYVFRRYFRGKR